MFTPRLLRTGGFRFADVDVEVLEEEWQAPDLYDREVDRTWRDTLAQASHPLWDGLHYRVVNTEHLPEQGKLTFRLGTVRYRYVATFSRLDREHAALCLPPFFHLTTFALPQTREGDYLFGRRASNGAIDFIGGGVQKDEIAVSTGADLETNLYKEIGEEMGIPPGAIAQVRGLGIVMSATSNVLMAAHVALDLSGEDVRSRFAERPDDEMVDLIFVPPDALRSFLGTLPDYRRLVPDLL